MALVDETLARVSDDLFKVSLVTYAFAMVSFTAEYAFGRRGRIARTAVAPVEAKALVDAGARRGGAVLVGAGSRGASVPPAAPPSLPAVPPAPTPSAPSRTTASGEARGSAGDRFGRFAVLALIVGAAVQLGAIVTRGWAVERVPWGNMYEFASVAALLAVVAFLAVLVKAPTIRYLGAFVTFPVLVLMFLAGTVLYARAQTLVPALQSYWLAIHVSSVAVSEGLLMTSAVVTVLYLVRKRSDGKIAATEMASGPVHLGPLSRFGAKLPAAATLDRVAYRIVAFAFPLYTFGVIAGAIWAEAAWGRFWGWDPKETWAFIAWVVYAAYLHARATAGWRGRIAAWINLLGFAAMTFNFIVVNVVIAGLHSYAGLN